LSGLAARRLQGRRGQLQRVGATVDGHSVLTPPSATTAMDGAPTGVAT
jgi:hypothetical protein